VEPSNLLIGFKMQVHLIRSFGIAGYLPYIGEAPSRVVDSGCMSPVHVPETGSAILSLGFFFFLFGKWQV
jgi:hypothetical protein